MLLTLNILIANMKFRQVSISLNIDFFTINFINFKTLLTVQDFMTTEDQTFQELKLDHFEDKPSSIAQYITSTITNMSYNIKYNQILSMPFITRNIIEIAEKDYAFANLLGKTYSYNKKDEFQQRFSRTIWMSYRSINDQGDVGWGCMIRVVQMVFAQAFQRCFKKANINQIITLFKDQANGVFSLCNICKKGRIQKRYTSSPEIYSIMTSVFEDHKTLLGMNLSIQNFFESLEIKVEQHYSKEEFPKLISILTKVGQQTDIYFDQNLYLSHMIGLIKDEHFCGIVGGNGNEALYIIGEYKNVAIILDPHYVQKQQKQETYFEKVPKGIQFSRLKSSFTFNFYIPSLQKFGQWVDSLILLQKVCSPYLCFSSNVKDPQGWTKNHRKKSEDFQFLV